MCGIIGPEKLLFLKAQDLKNEADMKMRISVGCQRVCLIVLVYNSSIILWCKAYTIMQIAK